MGGFSDFIGKHITGIGDAGDVFVEMSLVAVSLRTFVLQTLV